MNDWVWNVLNSMWQKHISSPKVWWMWSIDRLFNALSPCSGWYHTWTQWSCPTSLLPPLSARAFHKGHWLTAMMSLSLSSNTNMSVLTLMYGLEHVKNWKLAKRDRFKLIFCWIAQDNDAGHWFVSGTN